MNIPSLVLRAACAAALFAAPASAQVIYSSGALHLAVPDSSATGITHTLNVAESQPVARVVVNLNLSVPAGETGWSGDLYGYLQHDTGISILLNRPGRSVTQPFGYSDNQNLTISLRDDAANGDVHTYRPAVTGSGNTPLLGPLTGAWQPDGRAFDPDLVVDTDPRAAMLSQFNGSSAAGGWTLLLADLSSGSRYQLDSWSLELEFVPVPEPGPTALVTALLTLGTGLWLRRRHRSEN